MSSSREIKNWLDSVNNPGVCSALAGTTHADSQYRLNNPSPAVRQALWEQQQHQNRLATERQNQIDAMRRQTEAHHASLSSPIPSVFGSSSSSMYGPGSSSVFGSSSSAFSSSSFSSPSPFSSSISPFSTNFGRR